MGALFGGGSKTKSAEERTAPMPAPDDEQSRRVARRELASYVARSGRDSTMLSGGSGYARKRLGTTG